MRLGTYYDRHVAHRNPKPERLTELLPLASGGTYGALVVAERLAEHRDLAAVMVFVIGDGDTRLVAHAVVPGPDDWSSAKPSGWLLRLGWSLGKMTGDADADTKRLTSATQLTTRILRGVTTGELERWARQHISGDRRYASLGMLPGGDRKHRTGRGGGDRRLAQLAGRYVELLGETDAPNVALADEFGIARATVTSYLFRARERGLLTSPGRGRAGGALTERARALLTEKEDQE